MRRRSASRPLLLALALSALAARCGKDPSGPTPPLPPTLTIVCPSAQAGVSIRNQPVTIAWDAPATAGGTAPVQTTCTPASGSAFAVGATTVSCEARDGGSQRAACSFPVTVTRPPQLRVTRFLAFGDSITWGKDRPAVPQAFFEPAPATSYPSVLAGQLTVRYPDQTIDVINEGWPGETLAVGLARLPGVLATRPDVLMLLHGANDLNTTSANSALTVAIAERLREMVRTAKARVPGITVMLAQFPPQFHPTPAERGPDGRDNGAGADWVPELNGRIAAVAQAEGAILVDCYTPLAGAVKVNIGNDGLHPTVEGFALMADTMRAAVAKAFETAAAGAPAAR